jgi:hypothetical protein
LRCSPRALSSEGFNANRFATIIPSLESSRPLWRTKLAHSNTNNALRVGSCRYMLSLLVDTSVSRRLTCNL